MRMTKNDNKNKTEFKGTEKTLETNTLGQVWANYFPRAKFGPLIVFFRPTKQYRFLREKIKNKSNYTR